MGRAAQTTAPPAQPLARAYSALALCTCCIVIGPALASGRGCTPHHAATRDSITANCSQVRPWFVAAAGGMRCAGQRACCCSLAAHPSMWRSSWTATAATQQSMAFRSCRATSKDTARWVWRCMSIKDLRFWHCGHLSSCCSLHMSGPTGISVQIAKWSCNGDAELQDSDWLAMQRCQSLIAIRIADGRCHTLVPGVGRAVHQRVRLFD